MRRGLLVLGIGLAVLVFSQWPGPPRLGWSDEIVYAAMGRNIAAGRGAISSFYDARSIAARGYPLGDVHMPGQAFLLAAAFAVLGPGEAAAALVAAVCFLAAGLLLWRAARRVVPAEAAVACAAGLFLFPSLGRYASSAMAETPVVFLACLHLLLWWRARERPSASRLASLGLLLGVGATVRESFLALLVPSLLLLAFVPRGRRARATLALLLPLGAWLALVFEPLRRARAPYPFYLEDLLGRPTAAEVARAFLDNALGNLRALGWPAAEPPYGLTSVLLLLTVVAPLLLVTRAGPPRLAGLYALAAAVSTAVPLVFTYTFSGWTGLRSLLLFVPALLVAAAALVERARSRLVRRSLATAALAGLAAVAVFLDIRLVADQRQELLGGEREARAIERAFACAGPHVVVAEEAFRYGWRQPEAVVVWQGHLPASTLAAVARRAGARSVAIREAELPEAGEVTVVGCGPVSDPRMD